LLRPVAGPTLHRRSCCIRCLASCGVPCLTQDVSEYAENGCGSFFLGRWRNRIRLSLARRQLALRGWSQSALAPLVDAPAKTGRISPELAKEPPQLVVAHKTGQKVAQRPDGVPLAGVADRRRGIATAENHRGELLFASEWFPAHGPAGRPNVEPTDALNGGDKARLEHPRPNLGERQGGLRPVRVSHLGADRGSLGHRHPVLGQGRTEGQPARLPADLAGLGALYRHSAMAEPPSLFDFLARLDLAHLRYRLTRDREETVMVEVFVPGDRWEVEFFADGAVEVERFTSTGDIFGPEVLQTLLDFGDE
jgi:hypothetical protein